ncbi:hypothetical protein RZP08_27880, partial [Klebsiella pneumoniae]
DRNRSHWSTSKTPSYTKSVSWQHHRRRLYFYYSGNIDKGGIMDLNTAAREHKKYWGSVSYAAIAGPFPSL